MDVLQVVSLHVPQIVQENALLVVLTHVQGLVRSIALVHVITVVKEAVVEVVTEDVEADGGVPAVV